MHELRIGLVVDKACIPAWIDATLREIHKSTRMRIVLIAIRDTEELQSPQCGAGLVRRTLEAWRRVLFDRHPHLPSSETPVPITDTLEGADLCRVCWGAREPESEELDWLVRHELDVLVWLAAGEPAGCLLGLPRHGVWLLHHGAHTDAPTGFWEVMLQQPITSATLTMIDPATSRHLVLSRTHASTIEFSVRDNASSIRWSALRLLPRKLAELQALGGEAMLARVGDANGEPQPHRAAAHGTPDDLRYARLLLRLTWHKARHMMRGRSWFDQWILLYRFGEQESLELDRYTRLAPPADRIWADPFAWQREERYYIFFEEMPLATARGHISVLEISPAGPVGPTRVALQRPYHLSYPFLFDFNGELYMIPETGESGHIELYRCSGFPDRWEFVHNMMEGVRAYDATLVPHGGRWWMFVNIAEVDGASSWNELFLFSAANPLSREWTPHPHNPAVSDCRSARPAGPLFEHEGALYRPSQNSESRYGYGFNLCRIDVLNETDFQEQIVRRVLPNWAPDVVATHTYGRNGDLHVIDAQIRRRRP